MRVGNLKEKFFKVMGAIAIINILARILGFMRDVVIGYQYGQSTIADSIKLAYQIPNFIYIVVGGAVTTAFISVYSKLSNEKDKQSFITSSFTYITILITVITAILVIFADPILKLSFPGLEGEKLQLTTQIFYWIAPSTLLLVLSMWLSGILNVNQRFQLSTISTLIYNLGFIVVAIIFTPLLNSISYGLGALIGALIMVVMLINGLKKEFTSHFRFRFLQTAEMKRLWIIALPIMLGGASVQFYSFIQKAFASGLPSGYVAAIDNASKLILFPQAIIMTAVTTVIYPLLAKKVGANDNEGLSEIYRRGISMLNQLLLPTTIFVFFYSKEIVTIIFQYGNFDEDSTRMTSPLLQVLSLSMLALAGNVYISRFFYAVEKSYLTVLISLFCVFGVNIAVILPLLGQYGAIAIAWGTTISSVVNFILFILLAKTLLKLSLKSNLKNSLKSISLYCSLIIAMLISTNYIRTGWVWGDFIIGAVVFVMVFIVGMKLLGLTKLKLNMLLPKRAKSV
jgi:putative peptidoglycan lipid II flippase